MKDKKVIKCSVFNCDKEATVKIKGTRKYHCNEHWESIGILQFGCPSMYEEIPEADYEI